MSDPVDQMAPWTIKSIAVGTKIAILDAAHREKLTVGQWLERRVAEWVGDGSPEPRGPAPASTLSELAALIAAAGAMAAHTKLPGEVRSLINARARAAQGLPGRIPGKTAARLGANPDA